uniref:Uncharacterized protein n=1 Tax=Arundo donax TaxID=35708 RepID=A0A0A9FVU7_ARUDO
MLPCLGWERVQAHIPDHCHRPEAERRPRRSRRARVGRRSGARASGTHGRR